MINKTTITTASLFVMLTAGFCSAMDNDGGGTTDGHGRQVLPTQLENRVKKLEQQVLDHAIDRHNTYSNLFSKLGSGSGLITLACVQKKFNTGAYVAGGFSALFFALSFWQDKKALNLQQELKKQLDSIKAPRQQPYTAFTDHRNG